MRFASVAARPTHQQAPRVPWGDHAQCARSLRHGAPAQHPLVARNKQVSTRHRRCGDKAAVIVIRWVGKVFNHPGHSPRGIKQRAGMGCMRKLALQYGMRFSPNQGTAQQPTTVGALKQQLFA